MTTIQGPCCFVCGGTNVEKRIVTGVIGWSNAGPMYGRHEKDVCLDCEARERVLLQSFRGKVCRILKRSKESGRQD